MLSLQHGINRAISWHEPLGLGPAITRYAVLRRSTSARESR